MKRFYCLPGLSKSSLNRRLRRLAAEQDDPTALSDIVTDYLPVAASADRGIMVVDAPAMDCESRLTIEDVSNDEGIPTVEIQGSPSTSAGQPADQIAGTMPGLHVRYSSGDNFTGSISDDILATYMHCNMSLTDLGRWLRMLNFYFPHLPIDPRTILRTPRSNKVRCIGGGEFVHLGSAASHSVPTAFLPCTPPPPIPQKRSTEKRLSFSENTPPGATTAGCATIHSPLSSSPYNRDIPPVRFREDSPGIRPSTSPTLTSTDERLDYVVQTVRQLSIRLERVECKLDFLIAKKRKQHAEGVEVAVSCKEFHLPLASEVELMQLEAKLQDNGTRCKLIRLLSAYGGRSCGEAVRHILTRVISAAFAPQCNLLGMHGKTGIANKLIYMVMRDAVRVDSRFENMTDTEYNIVVREWLHNARLRKSLRANKGHVRTSVIILESQPEVPSTPGNM